MKNAHTDVPAPKPYQAFEIPAGEVEQYMLEPMLNSEDAGYVPLCAALHWIMTNGGTHPVALDDCNAWNSSVEELFPLIRGCEIELNGLPSGSSLTDRIPGHALAVILVQSPLHDSINDIALDAPSHIVCELFLNHEHWTRNFNDRLYEQGKARPTWTHLQVRKADILRRWPRPESKAKSEKDCYQWLLPQMQESPTKKPQSKDAFWREAKSKFKTLAARQFTRAWEAAIDKSGASGWSKAGRLPGNSNHRTS